MHCHGNIFMNWGTIVCVSVCVCVFFFPDMLGFITNWSWIHHGCGHVTTCCHTKLNAVPPSFYPVLFCLHKKVKCTSYYPIAIIVHVLATQATKYRIAENFWGRKLSRISRFCGDSRKFSPRNFRGVASFAATETKVFFAKIVFFTDPRKFSPSKVFRYTVYYLSGLGGSGIEVPVFSADS